MEKVFTINLGSASKKYSLFFGEKLIYSAHFEKTPSVIGLNVRLTQKLGDKREQSSRHLSRTIDAALSRTIDNLINKKAIENITEIDAFAIRLVAPGEYFQISRTVNRTFLKKLAEVKESSILHIDPVLVELQALEKFQNEHGLNIPIIAVSDSAFHRNIPDIARMYSLPHSDSQKYGLYRYGYHGLSVSSVLRIRKSLFGRIPSKTIVAHLGSGCSITAVHNSASIDTSMGYGTLDGLMMSSRGGDIDSSAALCLARKKNLSAAELEEYLHKSCGLLGLSGRSSDIRKLLKLEAGGNYLAAIALEKWVRNVAKEISSMAISLSGVDEIIFTGTIGERSDIMRTRICDELSWLGIKISQEKNTKARNLSDGGAKIHTGSSKAKVLIIKSNENAEIARIAVGML